MPCSNKTVRVTVMKAEEIRNYLKTWKQDDVLKLYTQTYRRLPKHVKEEIDEMIKDGPASDKPKQTKPKKSAINFEELEREVNAFIENAMAGYYYYRNSVVPKKKRSAWRFEVKGYLKDLMSIPADSEYYDQSNILLCRLYAVLGRATAFYTLASQDPFHVLGYEKQIDLLAEITDRILAGRPNDEVLKELLKDSLNGYVDYNTLTLSIHRLFYSFFRGRKLEHVVELAKEIFEPIRSRYEEHYSQPSFMITGDQIVVSRAYESLSEFITGAYMQLQQPMEAYDFAMDTCRKSDEEIALYVLLTDYTDDEDDWIAIYNRALKDKIEPRESLQERYQEYTENRQE